MSRMLIESTRAANGEPTLRATRADGRGVWLHSGRNPSAEAATWLSRQPLDADAFVLFGLGTGYPLRALLGRVGESTPVLVIEPDPAIVDRARAILPLAPVLASARVRIGHDWTAVETWAGRVRVGWDRIALLCAGGYGHVFAGEYGRVETLFQALHATPDAPARCPALFAHAPGTSVIVSTFNRPAEAARLVAALRRQRDVRGPLEILVVNDNGAHAVFDAVAALPRAAAVVRCFDTHYAGYGLALARNVGLRFARYDTAICLDDDLEVDDHLVRAYQEAPSGLRLGRIDFRVSVEGQARVMADPRGAIVQGPTTEIDDLVRYRGFVYGGNFAIPTRLALAVGGFDEAFLDEGEEDVDFGARVMAAARAAFAVPAARALHDGPTLTVAHRLGLEAPPQRVGLAVERLQQAGRGSRVNGGLAYWLGDRWQGFVVSDPTSR
jgi:hypothetical protein